jgi:hypothetical protein
VNKFTPGEYMSDKGHPIAPAYRCVIYLMEEISIRAALIKAIGTMKGIPTLLEFMRRNLPESQIEDREDFDRKMDFLIRETPVSTAEELEKSEFAILHAHGLSSMWSSVEANMEDTFVNLIVREPSNISAIAQAFPRLRAFSAPLTEADARHLARKWEAACPEVDIDGRWISMAALCGVTVTSDAQQDTGVREINEVRNCILHRHGVIDQRAVNKAPTLAPFLGQNLQIDSTRYMSYFDALTGFIVRLTTALEASPYAAMAPLASQTI